MRKILSILILISIFSCNKVNETKKEVNAVQEVLNFYNGECLKSKGIELKNGVEKHTYELEISKSELLEQDKKNIKSHSGNIAYLFYTNLENEKSNYDYIKVKINLANGKSEEFKYSDKEIIEIEKLEPKIKTITNLIVQNDYENLTKEFDNSITVDRKNIENLFNTLKANYGKISKTQFQGFEFAETNNFGKVIIIKEAVLFEKINATMNLIINRENKQLLLINFP